MLVHLAVRNLAIVDNVEFDLGAGMTVLTGETGAGKSLIVDALELVVGGRASAAMVRVGASSAEVHAVFNASESVLNWLREQSLDDDEPSCVLRRTLGADGRSRAFINSRPVAIAQLRDLGEQLVDVHGQHTHQALLKAQAQRDLIDEHGQHAALLAEVAGCCEELRSVEAQISALSLDEENPASRLDFLRFQIEELNAQPLDQDTLDALQTEHKKLANAAEILTALSAIQQLVDGDEGVQEKIVGASRSLGSLLRLDDALSEPLQLLRDGASAIADAHSALQRYAQTLQADAHRLVQLERMLGVIHDLARKHRCSAAQLQARAHALESECERISGAAGALRAARAARERVLAHYRKQAKRLSKQRTASGASMAKAATAVLATLGMADARIEFSIEHLPTARPLPSGTDEVALCVSTNPGQPLLPIAKVASGGELSRIALAIQTSTVGIGGAHTVVFDEVDSGVGGAVAEIVGRRMRDLGNDRQVLTVTHLPQVAALAHQHVLVSKISTKHASHSEIVTLSTTEREQEIARMLGGLEVTATTLDHAREMLRAAAAEPASRI